MEYLTFKVRNKRSARKGMGGAFQRDQYYPKWTDRFLRGFARRNRLESKAARRCSWITKGRG
jgi:hypothetical protein